jgi:predicted nucleic acid-binding protein
MTHAFHPEDTLFLDTNVWLSVFGPSKPGDKRSASYSEAFARLLSAGSRVFIDILVVSEFVNTYARLKWKVEGKHVADFKDFRRSPAFQPIARDIAADLKRVLIHCSWTEHAFDAVDLLAMVEEYAGGDSDINDLAIVRICRNQRFTLITHDADFAGQNVPILTANPRLLRGN